MNNGGVHVLPWDIVSDADRLFRRVLLAALGILLVLSVTLPFLPLQAIQKKVAEEAPVLTRVVLEKKVLPKPPPPKPKPRKEIVKAQPKPVQKPKVQPKPRPVPEPEPVDTLARARDTAKATGVLAFRDDLQSLRDSVDVEALNQTRTSRGAADAVELQRSVITHKGMAKSGGIQAVALSTDTGGRALSGRETTSVRSDIAGTPGAGGTSSRAVTDSRGGRSDDAIRRVMDMNKGAIFALYNRALRRNPMLEGKLVFEMVIHPDGSVTELNLISSELADKELMRRILSRIRVIQFGRDDVLSTRVNYSFDFLPYT
jgi:outer membrane biosynthesis protein TonB